MHPNNENMMPYSIALFAAWIAAIVALHVRPKLMGRQYSQSERMKYGIASFLVSPVFAIVFAAAPGDIVKAAGSGGMCFT